jgi:DNA-binding transcriptional MerR regulator
MLNIGDFAPLGGVSVRMLRHYDDLGLHVPWRWTRGRAGVTTK